jgi:ribosomal protein L5
MSLYKDFGSKIKLELQKKLKKKNIHEVPYLGKVIISMGI